MTGVRAGRKYDKIQEQIDRSLRSDPAIAELIDAARGLRAEATNDDEAGSEIETAVLLAAGRLFRTQEGQKYGFRSCLSIVRNYVLAEFPRDETGNPQPISTEIRVEGLPGVKGRAVWLLREAPDVDALRNELATGQVWVRADLVTAAEWGNISAIAADQVRRLGKIRRAGRRPGWRSAARSELLEAIQADPSMTDEQIDQRGTELDLWEPSLGDYVLISGRARRVRKDGNRARRTKTEAGF